MPRDASADDQAAVEPLGKRRVLGGDRRQTPDGGDVLVGRVGALGREIRGETRERLVERAVRPGGARTD